MSKRQHEEELETQPDQASLDVESKPTDSHALAAKHADIDTIKEKELAAVAQVGPNEPDVKDDGWNDGDYLGPQEVITGMQNEQLWALIRRFDNQTFHVKKIDEPPLANLDMNIAEDEEFSPEKLRAHLERLYTSVIVQLVAAWKHVARLRSWNEYRRTSTYLACYTTAWCLDLLLPATLAFLMLLILSPAARDACFPPLLPKVAGATPGRPEKQDDGLPSDTTLTGAPERQAGEGAEQEAHSFLNSIATLLVSTSVGKKEDDGGETDASGHKVPNINTPDMTQLQKDMIHAEDNPAGQDAAREKTKHSVSKMVWARAEETMRIIARFVDDWERFGNALSPSPPFYRKIPRLLVALCLVLPPLLGSYFLTSYLLVKGLGFVIGVSLFGHPAVSRVGTVVKKNYPKFEKYLELRHSILRGVPTNAQLAITLLRVGENSKTPVPPPQSPDLAAAHEQAMAQEDKDIARSTAPKGTDVKAKQTKSRGGFLGFIKSITGGGIHVVLATDRVKAAVGERHAKDRLGVVEQPGLNPFAGPVRFPARHKGRKGHAYITTTATSPALSWTSSLKDVDPAWTVAIADIVEVRKIGGLGWKSKIMVHWALEKGVVDGLTIKTARDEEYHLTAVTLRDELFNRLISAGPQMWESL